MTIKVIEEQYWTLVRQNTDRPRIIAEGDSWLSPLLEDNLLRHVDRYFDFHILNLAEAGDKASDIFSSAQLHRLSYAIDDDTGFGFDAILLSAGGNDLLGTLNDPRSEILVQFPPGQGPNDEQDAVDRGVNKPAVADAIGAVADLYRTFLDRRRQICPNLEVWFHGYDLPFPSGKAADLWDPIDWLPVGPWLDPALHRAGIHVESHQRAVLAYLVDELQSALSALADPSDGVHYVDLAGALAWEGAWNDEIHPSAAGYQSVLARFRPRLDALIASWRAGR